MDASDDGMHPCICLFGDKDRTIELLINPEGALGLSFRDGTGKIVAGLGITADDQTALFLNDFRTGTRTELGTGSPAGEHRLALYHRGKLAWTNAKSPKRRKKL